MTTASLTPQQESVSSGREQQASTLASQDAGNPFLDVRRAWNGVWEESLSNGRRWRLMALVEAGLLALALFGLIHLGSQPKAIPYVVEVNKLGEVAYAGRLEPARAWAALHRCSTRLIETKARWLCDAEFSSIHRAVTAARGPASSAAASSTILRAS